MRRILVIAALCLCAATGAAQEPTQRRPATQDAKGAKTAQGQATGERAATGGAEQEVARLISRHVQALQGKDTSVLDQIWADDLTFINPGGQALTKAQRIENVRSGATKFDSIDIADQKIRVYGEAAVTTNLVTIKGQYSGQEGSGQYRTTLVAVRRGGQWQVVAIQMTPVASQQNTQPTEKKP